MDDRETVIRAAHSDDDPRTSVSLKTEGLELVLFFDDPGRQGPLRELRLLPGDDDLEPTAVRRLAPKAPLYIAYARAAMSSDDAAWTGTIQALRMLGRPGRGLSDEFYRVVASSYQALVVEGEPHPVKALGEMHNVTISAASRWVKEARLRGYIDEKEKS